MIFRSTNIYYNQHHDEVLRVSYDGNNDDDNNDGTDDHDHGDDDKSIIIIKIIKISR